LKIGFPHVKSAKRQGNYPGKYYDDFAIFHFYLPLTFIFCHFSGGLTNEKGKAKCYLLPLDTSD
jgi:hypothetical protein